MNEQARADERIRWYQSIPFFALHLTLFLPPFTGISWTAVALLLGSFWLRLFAVTAGYHRYFSHRSYKTSRVFQLILAFWAETSVQKGVLWWASHHRQHHQYSDTDQDVHSPIRRGFWWAHVGWILSRRWEGTDFERVKDLARYPELRWLNKHYLVPPVLYAAALTAAFGWEGLLWGFGISTVVLWHATFTINSLAHVLGRRRYATSDQSRNSLTLALLTLGEGWHNNHHHYQSAVNQGFFWWEIDLTLYGLKALRAVRVVWDLRKPPVAVIEATAEAAPHREGGVHGVARA